MTDPFTRAIGHFNAQEYREALLVFEERWHTERTDFLRGLIQLCNALNQLRLGLVSSPRVLLASADGLLSPYAPYHEGLDVEALRAYIHNLRACIPDGLETGMGQVPWDTVPRILITIKRTEG